VVLTRHDHLQGIVLSDQADDIDRMCEEIAAVWYVQWPLEEPEDDASIPPL
jgi:hypothetical protein